MNGIIQLVAFCVWLLSCYVFKFHLCSRHIITILFYGWIIIYCVYIHHNLFTLSSVDEHLVNVNRVATNRQVCFCFSLAFSVVLGIYLWVEFLVHIVILYLTYRGTSKLFHGGCTILYFTCSVWGFPLLHILANTFLIIAILFRCEVYLIIVLIAFCWRLMVLSIFSMCLLTVCISLEKCLCKSFAHFLIVLSFCCWRQTLLIIKLIYLLSFGDLNLEI